MEKYEPKITSILNDDLYKISMGQAILFSKFSGVSYQNIKVEYDFINRNKTKFPTGFDDLLRHQVKLMSELQLTDDEAHYLSKLSYIKPGYIDFLKGYRYDPSEVKINQNSDGNLSVKISGYWYRTVFWEVKLLSLISELYHSENRPDSEILPNYISLDDVSFLAKKKAKALAAKNITFSDFGTRRRYSHLIQDTVVSAMKDYMVGTSNVYFAKKYNIKPIGTHAHEFFMAHAALFGYPLANQLALECWAKEFDGELGIALSDTFTSDVFFRQFRKDLALLFNGVRQDSGDPIVFADKAINFYNSMNIDTLSKTIVFSDSLNVDKAIEISNYCDGKIKSAFGIGTNFTADIPDIDPLNIVIKMTKCNGRDTVKLSDSVGKYTGNPVEIQHCKYSLGVL